MLFDTLLGLTAFISPPLTPKSCQTFKCTSCSRVADKKVTIVHSHDRLVNVAAAKMNNKVLPWLKVRAHMRFLAS